MKNKIVLLLLKWWNSIMTKYAHNQLEKLKEDFSEIVYQNQYYSQYCDILTIMWLLKEKPKTTIRHETDNSMLLEVVLENPTLGENNKIYIPLTNYTTIIKNLLKIQTAKRSILPESLDLRESTEKLYKHMLTKVINEDVN